MTPGFYHAQAPIPSPFLRGFLTQWPNQSSRLLPLSASELSLIAQRHVGDYRLYSLHSWGKVVSFRNPQIQPRAESHGFHHCASPIGMALLELYFLYPLSVRDISGRGPDPRTSEIHG